MDRSTIITFTSDFGLDDGYVGIVKGSIKSINPTVEIIDLSHQIKPFDVRSAAWIIFNAYKFFPQNSIHLVVVDPAVGSSQRRILLTNGNYHFVGPDSGVFSYILNEGSDHWRSYQLTNPELFLKNVSSSFHARDIFGPVAAHLSKGVSPEKVGPGIEVSSINKSICKQVMNNGNKINGEIVYIDRFGNLITNILSSLVAQTVSNSFVCSIKETKIKHLSSTYSSSAEGEILVFPGSHGFLEIAVNQGSARDRLKCGIGDPVLINETG